MRLESDQFTKESVMSARHPHGTDRPTRSALEVLITRYINVYFRHCYCHFLNDTESDISVECLGLKRQNVSLFCKLCSQNYLFYVALSFVYEVE